MRGASPKAGDPPLALYALAQVHADEVKTECATRCANCPGPDADDGCAGRPFRQGFLKRTDWPRCQLGMLRETAWQGVVSLYRSAQVAPPSGWPDAYPAFVVEGMVELKLAVAKAAEERAKKTAKQQGSGPVFTGRSSKDGPA